MTRTETDLRLPCLVHDLNNVFQTLAGSGGSAGRRSALDAALRGDRAQCGTRQEPAPAIQNVEETAAPFEEILGDSIAFVEDSLIGGRGPRIEFDCDIDSRD